MTIELTSAEIRAILRALGETLDATDDGERRTIFGTLHAANAGWRAQGKLRRALARDVSRAHRR